MFRRSLGSAFALTLAATAIATAAVELPRANCSRLLADETGDGKYKFAASPEVKHPQDPSVDAVDILAVTMRDTPAGFQVYVKVKSMTQPHAAYETAYRYDVKFTNADGTRFVLQALRENPTYADKPTPPRAPGNTDFAGTGGRGGFYPVGRTSESLMPGIRAEWDTAGGWVVLTVPLSELQRGFTTTVGAGTEILGISAETYAYIPHQNASGAARIADTATSTDPKKTTYTIGDEYCFGPPPGTLTLTDETPRVTFSDGVPVSATLKSEEGQPLSGKTVTFTVEGEPAKSAVTNASGVATATVTTKKPVGSYPVVAYFAGDTNDGWARATGTLTVTLEATKFAPLKSTRISATARTVTATLTDDDGKSLAAQRVEWWVNGKKVAAGNTDGAGRAVYKTARAGQTVQARYGGLSGKYTGSASKALKV